MEIDGRRYLDGGLVSPVPVAEAIAAGATHVLALQTRPFGIPRKSASRIGDRLIERHLRGLNPALVTVYRERIGIYEQLVDDLARRSGDHAIGPPHVLGLRPPAGTPQAALDKLETALQAAVADPTVAERFAELGTAPATAEEATPAALGTLLTEQIALWKPLIEAAGAKAQ